MLILSRKVNEFVRCTVNGVTIDVYLTDIRPSSVRIGVVAPDDVKIVRGELLEKDLTQRG